MALRDVLPQIIQPFRFKATGRAAEPMFLGPLDVLRLMEFVERNSRRGTGELHTGASLDGTAALSPEPGFRY